MPTGEGRLLPYLDQFDYDIFVSYAHVDDEPVAGADHGWVTHLVRCLKAQLARKLGRSDAYTLWMDHDLRNSAPLTQQILDRVRRSAMLVILLSPGYVASTWCRQEREAFFRIIRERGAPNVFVVELDCVDNIERPPELCDLNPIRFWRRNPLGGAPRILGWPRPNPDDHDYYSAVGDLVHEMVDEMRRLRAQTAAADPSTARNGAPAAPRALGAPVDDFAEPLAAVPGQSTVYIAQVTDDLDIERNNVRRFLEQAGLRVVPRGWYSMEPAAFRRSATMDIAAADLYVQLLSGVAGKRPPDLAEGYAQCQLQLALAAGKPVLQWRGPTLDPSSVEDQAHRALLESATVRAEGIEEFKATICREAERLRMPPPRSRDAGEAFVFVDMDSSDRALAEELCDILDRHGAGYLLPIETQDPGAYRQDLEKNLAQCNALIVIYGSTTSTWVRNHLLESRKALANRALPLRALAVFQGPPAPKDRLPVKFPSMTVLDCQLGLNEAEVVRFLRTLEG
jgi:hypothetical protein